jgi:hypothetical protein
MNVDARTRVRLDCWAYHRPARAAKQPEFLRDVQNLRVAQPTFGGRVAQWLSVERRCDEGLSAVVRARAELPLTFGAPVGARWRPFGVGST